MHHDLEEPYQHSGRTRGMTRLHPDEVAIDETLVRRLLSTQLPELAGLPLEPVRSQGTDNIVYRLGPELSVRLPRKLSAVPSLLIERDWLPRLAPSVPLAVPVPVASGEPDELYPFPWAVCIWVPGTRLGFEELGRNGARALAEFVAALHSCDASQGPQVAAGQRGGPVAAYDQTARTALRSVLDLQTAGRIEPDLVDGDLAAEIWSAAVAAPAWQEPGVWTHRDLHGGNLLTTGARLTGVIDFGGLIVGDPAADVMGAFHVLSAADRRLFCDLVGVDDATLTRARGLALCQGLEALPYYLDTHPGMVAFAHRAIAATLGQQ
ncbi:MAG TPA: aminoglycoside phosphotransferase family protein [Propionibacteriaceae bacterium]|nr:aminoglycoside phosphotransferase family protein [Propionibacteriaceae bacterium]